MRLRLFTVILAVALSAPARAELFHKGRGVGDCGSIGTWKWTGTDFRLVRFLLKDNCDGQPFLDKPSGRWQVFPRR